MHPVANEVLVPTESVERELLGFAERRFTGRVKLSLRVKPEAALCVELLPTETTERQRPGHDLLRSPDVFPGQASHERGLLISRFLRQNAERFRLVVKPSILICEFKEGTLGDSQWITVG